MILNFFRKKKPSKRRIIEKPFLELNERFYIDVVTETLMFYDPKILNDKHEAFDEDWWVYPNKPLPKPITEGAIGSINLNQETYGDIRFTSHLELTEYEREYAVQLIEPVGLKIESGILFITGAENLPSAENNFAKIENMTEEAGVFVKLPPGDYDLFIYNIDTSELLNIENEECTEIRNNTARLVIFIRPRVSIYSPPNQFSFEHDKKFLFPSEERTKRKRLGPGDILKAKVWRNGRIPPSLVLKEHSDSRAWPKNYTIILQDMSSVKWQDKIKLKITEINKETKTIKTEFAGYFEEKQYIPKSI